MKISNAIFSSHAEYELEARGIERKIVIETLESPDSISEGKYRRNVYQKIYHDEILNKPMLCRVVVEDQNGLPCIITIYKTSQFEKYNLGR